MTFPRTAILLVAAGASFAAAQDPAPGWMGYATAKGPEGSIITSIEATWVVPKDPEVRAPPPGVILRGGGAEFRAGGGSSSRPELTWPAHWPQLFTVRPYGAAGASWPR